MGATAAIFRAVSSIGSTPTPKRCMLNPAMSAVGAYNLEKLTLGAKLSAAKLE